MCFFVTSSHMSTGYIPFAFPILSFVAILYLKVSTTSCDKGSTEAISLSCNIKSMNFITKKPQSLQFCCFSIEGMTGREVSTTLQPCSGYKFWNSLGINHVFVKVKKLTHIKSIQGQNKL